LKNILLTKLPVIVEELTTLFCETSNNKFDWNRIPQFSTQLDIYDNDKNFWICKLDI